MTVAELIERLKQLPNQDRLVVVRDYEAGVDSIRDIEEREVHLSDNLSDSPGYRWYYGEHSTCECFSWAKPCLKQHTTVYELVESSDEGETT